MLPGEAFRGENITDENCICYAGGWKQPRFGANKLLYEIDGIPMYRHVLEQLDDNKEENKKISIRNIQILLRIIIMIIIQICSVK